jgi:membrane-associated protease RseP (regulator of RpoE activity)
MSFELFFGVIIFCWLVVLWLERTGKLPAERHAILLLFKTERGKGFIERISKFKRFWGMFGSVAILIGILGMALVVFSLAFSTYSTYLLKEPSEGAMLVIPGVTIPFFEGIIALITVLVVHEFAHGILARREGVSIKSMGAILVTIIPIGAFVEPDEEELKAKERGARMRVYSAGPFANILLAIFVIIAFSPFSGNFFNTSITQIEGIDKCSPANGTLDWDMIIKDIDGRPISGLQDFFEIASELKPGQDVKINTDQGLFIITTAQHPKIPERGYIGITPTHPFYPGPWEFLFNVFKWIYLLNLGIGLINLAPLHLGIAATDGYYIFGDILSKLRVKNGEKVVQAVSMVVIMFLVLSLLGPVLVPEPGVVC